MDQLMCWASDGLGNEFNIVNRNVALASLQGAYKGPIQPSFCGHAFLGHASVDPYQTDIPCKDLA